jgi:hypothetical protein
MQNDIFLYQLYKVGQTIGYHRSSFITCRLLDHPAVLVTKLARIPRCSNAGPELQVYRIIISSWANFPGIGFAISFILQEKMDTDNFTSSYRRIDQSQSF